MVHKTRFHFILESIKKFFNLKTKNLNQVILKDKMVRASRSSVQFSSVQFKMVSMLSGKPICAPSRLSGVSPVLPLKQFQCWSVIDDGPFSSSKGRSLSASSLYVSLLQTIDDAKMSLALSPQVVYQAPQHFRSSSET